MELSFVGRERELGLLGSCYRNASDERGAVAIVVGEPGVGKSRLIREFTSSVQLGSVLTVAAHEVTESPLRLWRSVATSADRKLGVPDEGSRFVFGLSDEQSPDMADIADRMLTLLLDLPAPVVLVIEDLQWADAASRRLLMHLAPMVMSEPVLIVATQRLDFSASPLIEGPSDARVIGLTGLSAPEVLRTLADRYPALQTNELEPAAAQLVTLTGGNPLACFGTIVGLERGRTAANVVEQLAVATHREIETPAVVGEAISQILGAVSESDKRVLAAIVLTGDHATAVLAEVLAIDETAVADACERGIAAGILMRRGVSLEVAHPLLGSRLIDDLPEAMAGEISARYAELLANATKPDWGLVLAYALRSNGRVPDEQICGFADSAAVQAFDGLAFEDADQFFGIAQERDQGENPDLAHRTRRLMRRAEANVRIGRMDIAYDLYRQAANLATVTGDAYTLARAAIGFAFPPDWRAGNADALELLMLAEEALTAEMADRVDDTADQSTISAAIQLKALRSMLEMRIPQPSDDGQQWAWVVRSEISQPRADEALDLADTSGDPQTRLIALLGWRWTHRGPMHLERRLRVSREALDLALELNSPLETLEACVRLVVDHLEAGQRQSADEVVAIAEWMNERARDSRVEWRTFGLRAGVAGIDGDWEAFERYRQLASDAGTAAGIPGAFVMDHALRTHRSIIVRDVEYLNSNEKLIDLVPMHPLTSAAVSCALADLGRTDDALDRIERTFPLLDDESSLLQSLAFLGKATVITRDVDHAGVLLPMLAPWVDRAAVDAEALMSSGSLGLIIANLAEVVGDAQLEASARAVGEHIHRQLHGTIGSVPRGMATAGTPRLLTDREIAILQEIARGRTNAEIADVLNFSLATVRRDTISIYNKLNVRGRANAASRAVEIGLITR
ncbi:MAG: AAA family ATPase [Candidatus Nanopelagicales bacterium]